MARVKHDAITRPPRVVKPDLKPRRPLAVMSTRPHRIETPSPENDKGTSSSTALAWGEDPWAGMDPGPKSQKQRSKLIDYCDKPGQFWPDGQEPAFKGQKSRRRVFVTKGKRQPRKEITNNYKEINRLKEDARQTQSFHPRTGDIELYHDYSDYEGSFYDEEEFFESLDDEDDVIPPAAVASIPPPEVTPVPPPTLPTSPDKFPTSQTAAPPTTATPTDASPPDGPAHQSVVALSEEQQKENRQSLIKRFRDKQNARTAEAARLKQEKEMHAHEEKEKLTAHERESAEQARVEQERVEQKRTEQKRLEQEPVEQKRVEQEPVEQKRVEQEPVEQKRIEQKQLEQERLQQKRVEQERQKVQPIIDDDTMDVDIEPGEVNPGSNAPSTNRRDPAPRRARAPPVAHRSHRSVSPPRQGYYSRNLTPPTRPTTYRDYAPSRFDRHPPPRRRSPSPDRFTRRRRSPSPDRVVRRRRSPSPDRVVRRRRSPSPDRFVRRGRSPSPIRDRGYHPPQTTRYRSPVQRRRRTPSPRRYSGPSAHVAMPPPTIVPAPHPSIPGTLALPMGLLQFMPSNTVTSAADFNRMGSRPLQNKTTHFILARMSSLSQHHDDNPLFPSLQNNTQSPLLRTACFPPYHGLYVISRGRLVVSNKTEIRLRLWRAQYPTVPLWFFAIRCLSRGLDWRVFANPRHLIGPLQSISCPRPAYLDHTPPLLTRGYGEFERYADSVMEMLRLPFARRFCTMGGLVWRLAMQYGPDNLFSCALSGPSSDAYMHSNADLIGADIDDKVKDAHLQLLLGVTVDGQSLWPPIDVFENHMQWEGEWNANLETWFIKHVTAIQNRETRAFATHSQWSSRLWQHNTTSSKDGTRVVTEAQAQLLCYDIDQLDPRSFAALD